MFKGVLIGWYRWNFLDMNLSSMSGFRQFPSLFGAEDVQILGSY